MEAHEAAPMAAVMATVLVALLWAFTTLAPSVLAVGWAVATVGGIYGGMAYEENE